MPRFSIIVHLKDTIDIFYRDMMESLQSQTFVDWDLYILDEVYNPVHRRFAEELFPGDTRIHFRTLNYKKTKAYALNIGIHFVLSNSNRFGEEDSYIFFMGQHDRLSENSLERFDLFLRSNSGTQVFYTDYDELIGIDKMYPKFMLGYNKELLRRRDYIGENFGMQLLSIRSLGALNEKLNDGATYEYLLRASEQNYHFGRCPGLLYHRRQYEYRRDREFRKRLEIIHREKMAVADLTLRRLGIEAEIKPARRGEGQQIIYDGSDYYMHTREYLMLRSDGIRVLTRNYEQRLYSYLKQKDVAVVGAKILKPGFEIQNIGYIFDRNARLYPSFYRESIFAATYEDLGVTPHDVSAVDFNFCMIDARVYRKLGGFDTKLSGRDRILDFCLRAKQVGLRTVVATDVIARVRGELRDDSTEASANIMIERYRDILEAGDPYYHPSLAMGLDNYKVDFEIYGEAKEETDGEQ